MHIFRIFYLNSEEWPFRVYRPKKNFKIDPKNFFFAKLDTAI